MINVRGHYPSRISFETFEILIGFVGMSENKTQNIPAWNDVFQATMKDDLAAVKYFIEERGESVTATDSDQRSIALIAAEYGHLPILKYILEKNNTLVSYPDKAHHTVLERAIQKGDLSMVKYLVEDHKVDILAIDHYINTAVHVAAQEGQLEILKYFIEEKNVDVNIGNENGEPLLFLAAEKPYINVIMYLLEERQADPLITDCTNDNILFKSGRHGDVTVPKYLLDVKKIPLEVNSRNTEGYTAVNWACKFNQTEFVEYMVENKNADVSIPDTGKGRTPLHHAAAKDNRDLCKFLIEHGADADKEDNFGYTAIQLTSDQDAVSYLYSHISTTQGHRQRRGVTNSIILSHSQFQPKSTKKVRLVNNAYRSDVAEESSYLNLINSHKATDSVILSHSQFQPKSTKKLQFEDNRYWSKNVSAREKQTKNIADGNSSLNVFNTLLTVFNMTFRDSRNSRSSNAQISSPSQQLNERMNGVAISAVGQLPDF